MGKENDVLAMTPEETLQKTEEALKRLDAANAKLIADRTHFAIDQANAMLAGKAEAGQEPAHKTKEQLIVEDIQNTFPNDMLPRNLRKK